MMSYMWLFCCKIIVKQHRGISLQQHLTVLLMDSAIFTVVVVSSQSVDSQSRDGVF